jgi:hypothetical protein
LARPICEIETKRKFVATAMPSNKSTNRGRDFRSLSAPCGSYIG